MSARAEVILGLPVRADRWSCPAVIDPEKARKILEAMPPQRPVYQRHVTALMEEIKAGRFARTNEGVAFDEAGLLFDGQHRLWACFMSAMPIEVLCCFNEPRENFARIGRLVNRRSEGQVMVIEGTISTASAGTTLANAARFIWAYEAGRNPTQAAIFKGWNDSLRNQVIAAHDGLIQATTDFRSRRIKLFPLVPVVALATLFREADEGRAAIFLHQLATGEGLSAGDPALSLREKAMRGQFGRRGAATELSYALVRAWNAFRDGRRLEKIYGSSSPNSQLLRVGGLDPFPRVSGLRSQATMKEI